MRFYARREAEAIGQFFREHLLRVIAHHDVNFVLARVEIVEQALGIKRAAGSGDGNEYFQTMMPQYGRVREVEQAPLKNWSADFSP